MPSVKEIQAVRNACTVIEEIALRQPVGVSELARATGIDKSTTHRLAVTLRSAGWLVPGTGSPTRWQLAPELARLAQRAGTSALTVATRPTLESLRDATGESVLLAVLVQGHLLVTDVAESRAAVRMSARVGSTLPVERSASGRVIAADLPPDELEELRRAHPGLDGSRTLAAVRRRGWAASDREVSGEVRSVGAAVLGPEGYPLGAVVVSGPVSRVTTARMRQFGELAARAVEAPPRLGP